MHQRAADRCRFDRGIRQVVWYSLCDERAFERRRHINAGRETRHKPVQIIGHEITAVTLAADADQRLFRGDRLQTLDKGANGLQGNASPQRDPISRQKADRSHVQFRFWQLVESQ